MYSDVVKVLDLKAEPELKPCPFCPDGQAKINSRYIGYGSIGLGEHDLFRGECKNCGSRTNEYKTKAEAIAAWNTRAEPPRKDGK